MPAEKTNPLESLPLACANLPDYLTRAWIITAIGCEYDGQSAFPWFASIYQAYENELRHIMDDAGRQGIQAVINILKSEEFKQLVNNGTVTLAMIKPYANFYTGREKPGTTDRDTVDQIIQFIHNPNNYPDELPLTVLCQASTVMGSDFYNDFYGGTSAENQKSVPPMIEDLHAQNRWEENKLLLGSGAMTLLVIYDSQGKAAERFRQLQGHWKPEKRDSRQLRYVFGGGDTGLAYHSVTHGSENPTDALREFGVWIEYLQRCISTS